MTGRDTKEEVGRGRCLPERWERDARRARLVTCSTVALQPAAWCPVAAGRSIPLHFSVSHFSLSFGPHGTVSPCANPFPAATALRKRRAFHPLRHPEMALSTHVKGKKGGKEKRKGKVEEGKGDAGKRPSDCLRSTRSPHHHM